MKVKCLGALTLLLVLTLTSTAIPQENNKTATTDEAILKLKERLSLTADQTEQVKALLLESKKRNDEIKKKHSDDRRQMLLSIKEAWQTTDGQIEELLSDEQKAIYQNVKAERREEWRTRTPKRRTEP